MILLRFLRFAESLKSLFGLRLNPALSIRGQQKNLKGDVMLIIFGWGHQESESIGPVFQNKCDHCHNDVFWELHRISTWFTIFFLPIFPYTDDYMLLCPICSYGFKIEKEQISKMKAIAESNTALIEGKISQDEYAKRIAAQGQ